MRHETRTRRRTTSRYEERATVSHQPSSITPLLRRVETRVRLSQLVCRQKDRRTRCLPSSLRSPRGGRKRGEQSPMELCLPHSLARPDVMGPLKASKATNSASKSLSWQQQSPVSTDRIAAAHNAQMGEQCSRADAGAMRDASI